MLATPTISCFSQVPAQGRQTVKVSDSGDHVAKWVLERVQSEEVGSSDFGDPSQPKVCTFEPLGTDSFQREHPTVGPVGPALSGSM